MGKDTFGFGGVKEADAAAPKPALDLSAFKPRPEPSIDRGAADAAIKVGEASGFSSRAPRAAPESTKGRDKNPGRVRLTDIVGPTATITGTKAQLNLTAPADLIIRFKELSRRRGDAAQWQTLSAALDAIEKEDR